MAVLWLIFQFPMLGMFWRPVAGLAGGLFVALVVIFCARDISRPRFVLIGIGVSWFFAAGIGVFMTTADVRDVQTALMWLSGSLHAANWMLVGISACWMLPAALLLLFTARTADIALLGHQVATGLGVIACSRANNPDSRLRFLRWQHRLCRADSTSYITFYSAWWTDDITAGERRIGGVVSHSGG